MPQAFLPMAIAATVSAVVSGSAGFWLASRRREVPVAVVPEDTQLSRALADSIRDNKDKIAIMAQRAIEHERTVTALHRARKELNELLPLKDQVVRLKGDLSVHQAEVEHYRKHVEPRRKLVAVDDFADTQVDPEDEAA